MKKNVLKLEFCLQEARAQTRKLQRVHTIFPIIISLKFYHESCLWLICRWESQDILRDHLVAKQHVADLSKKKAEEYRGGRPRVSRL